MGKWLDVKGPILADTVYADNRLVARDVEFTLPGLNFQTATISAMGNMDVALVGLLENMELTINKVGTDEGFSNLIGLGRRVFEFRWAQTSISKNGDSKTEGVKAFVKTLPLSIPDIAVKPGDAVTTEHKYTVTRLELYVGGEEKLVVDRLNTVLRVNRINYAKDFEKYL